MLLDPVSSREVWIQESQINREPDKDPKHSLVMKHFGLEIKIWLAIIIFFFLFFSIFILHFFQSGSNTKMAVFTAIFYFLGHESKDVQGAALQALGFICIRHYDLMMQDSLKLK
jgi:hypothetical protein